MLVAAYPPAATLLLPPRPWPAKIHIDTTTSSASGLNAETTRRGTNATHTDGRTNPCRARDAAASWLFVYERDREAGSDQVSTADERETVAELVAAAGGRDRAHATVAVQGFGERAGVAAKTAHLTVRLSV